MANVIEIVLRTINEANSGIESATKELDDLEKQTKSSQKRQEEFAKGAALAGTILVGVGAAVKDITDTYVEYANQVRDLNQLTGAQAEEASRLIQVSDDAQVSYEQLSRSLEYAVRNGIDPSVKSLADLSDQYLALEPGLDRSSFLMDTFGRSGMDMANIMEQGSAAIYEQSNQINTKLILDDKAIEKSVELAAAQDDLEDSLLAVKLALGEYLVPLLKQAADGFLLVLTYNYKLKTAFEQHADEVITTSSSYADYKAEIERTAKVANMYIDTQGNLRDGQGRIWEMNYLLTESEYAVEQQVKKSTEAILAENAAVAKRKSSSITIATNYTSNHISASDPTRTYALAGGYADGGDFVVPPGYPNDSYPLRVESGERVRITPAGQSGGGGGNVTIVYAPQASFASQEELKRNLVPLVRQVMRGA